MTRCISCTRCVRFITEVAGVPEMGQTGRGEDAEITSYLGRTLTSELQGNIVDLCPVGALANKPYAYTARPWELTKTETIDVMDALGSNIRVDTKGREVMRILPRNHDGINEEWLADRSRYVWDGLRRQRLDRPYIREGGRLRPAGWDEALTLAASRLRGAGKVAGLVGDLAPVEAAFALKALVEGLGGSVECRTDGAALPAGNRGAYAGTAAIEDIDRAERILLDRHQPAGRGAGAERAHPQGLAARRRGGADRARRGPDLRPPPSRQRGRGGRPLGRPGRLVRHPRAAVAGHRRPVGAADGARGADPARPSPRAWRSRESGLLVLHTAASRVGAMDVGATTEGGIAAALDGADVVLNLGADEIELPRRGRS